MMQVQSPQALLTQMRAAHAADARLVVRWVARNDGDAPRVALARQARWKGRLLNVVTLGAAGYYGRWKLLNAARILTGTSGTALADRLSRLSVNDMHPTSLAFCALTTKRKTSHTQAPAALSQSVDASVMRSLEQGGVQASHLSPADPLTPEEIRLAAVLKPLMEESIHIRTQLKSSPPRNVDDMNASTARLHKLQDEVYALKQTTLPPLIQSKVDELDATIEYWNEHLSDKVPQKAFDEYRARMDAAPKDTAKPQSKDMAKQTAPKTAPPKEIPKETPPQQTKATAPPAAPPAAAPSTAPKERSIWDAFEAKRYPATQWRNRRATPERGEGAAYYLEKQSGLLCGKHALNAFFGSEVLGSREFVAQAIKSMVGAVGEEMALDLVSLDGLSDAFTLGIVAEELRKAGRVPTQGKAQASYLELRGLAGAAKAQRAQQLERALQDYNGERLLVGNDNHWMALRRDKQDAWWVLDSQRSAPQKLNVRNFVDAAGGATLNFIGLGERLNLA